MKRLFLQPYHLEGLYLEGAKSCNDCDPTSFDYPDFQDGCDDNLEEAGLAGWIAIRCSVSFTDITDEAEWDAKIAAGEVVGRFDGDFIRGSVSAPDRNKIQAGACGTEKTVSKTYTVNLIDSGYDSGKTKYDLYNYFDESGELWNYGYVDCNGNFYGFYDNATFEADEEVAETNSEVKNFIVNISFKTGRGVNKPTLLAFLINKQLHQ